MLTQLDEPAVTNVSGLAARSSCCRQCTTKPAKSLGLASAFSPVAAASLVGSENSSNSLRLRELAQQIGTPAYLIDRADQIDPAWIAGVERVGVTAGASSPEYLVQTIVARLRELGEFEIAEYGEPEPEIIFTMPREISLI